MDRVLILDFGSQVTQLIARRIRNQGVYCEIYPYNTSRKKIELFSPKALVLSGGPASTTSKKPLEPDSSIFNLKIPILGICYGHQILCKNLGGRVISSKKREFGKAFIKIKRKSKIFEGIYKKNNQYQVWMSYGDKVNKLPKLFKVIASTSNAKFAAIVNEDKKIYGLQFHPEVIHTLDGDKILENFVKKIALCKSNWKISNFIENSYKKIKDIVKNENVICALSGGVDSSVTAALLHKSIGKQLKCIFVDTGLLRKGEGDEIELKAIERAFKGRVEHLSLSSTKSSTGHLLGAAGAVEAIFSILSIQNNIVPPTINLDDLSIDTKIDLVPHESKEKEINSVLSNSFGFVGTNASVIFSRY